MRAVLSLAAILATFAVAASVAAASATRTVTMRDGDTLVVAGTDVRCLLDGDGEGVLRGPVALHCVTVDPAVERRVLTVGGLPFGRPASYAVHASLWGAAILTRVIPSPKGDFQGIPTVYERIVTQRADTVAGAPRRYSIDLGRFTLVNGRVPRVVVRAGDVVRVAGSRLTCRVGRDSTGATAMGCALEDPAGLVRGAHGILVAEVGAALTVSEATGIRPLVTRYHGR